MREAQAVTYMYSESVCVRVCACARVCVCAPPRATREATRVVPERNSMPLPDCGGAAVDDLVLVRDEAAQKKKQNTCGRRFPTRCFQTRLRLVTLDAVAQPRPGHSKTTGRHYARGFP